MDDGNQVCCNAKMVENLPSSFSVPAELIDKVERLFCSGHHYGPYQRMGTDVEVTVPNTLYGFPVTDARKKSYVLHVYSGLEGVGGYLWEREVRALLRLNTLRHPALPVIVDGGHDEDANLAYVITESAKFDLGHLEGIPLLKSLPAQSMRQFSLLCDALSLLHGQGIVHRNLTPRAVQYVDEDPSGDSLKFSLRLARFEMSALVSNLLRMVSLGEERLDKELRTMWLGHSRRDRVYFAPERLGYLIPGGNGPMIDTDRSDVYGLGVLAWELFVGEFPPDILESTDRVAQGDLTWSVEIHRYMLSEMTKRRAPRHLRDLIEGMLVPEQSQRLQSGEVVQRLSESYTAFAEFAAESRADCERPYLVAFQPKQCRATVQKWNWVDQDPDSSEGREELIRFLRDDELRDAELLYFELGADIPAVTGEKVAAKREARYVLVGRRGVWFCKKLEIRRFGKVIDVCDDCLVIRFVAERQRAPEIEDIEFRRRISALDVVPADNDELVALERSGRPDWGPVMESVEISINKPEWRVNWERAINWLMEFQEIQLVAREYPYTVVPTSEIGRSQRRLAFDTKRDTTRIDRFRTSAGRASAMLKAYALVPVESDYQPGQNATRFRPTFGDFFEDIDAEEQWFEFCPDDNGKPNWRDKHGDVEFRRRLDDDHIEVTVKCGILPQQGWLRPKEDQGNAKLLERQSRARDELLANGALLRHLHKPASIRGIRHRWPNAGRSLSNVGQARDRVQEMLCEQTFYALHGPPGTGKTTIAASAIEAFFRAEPYARILVSAQSNFALDNMAIRIQKQLQDAGIDLIALRVATPGAEQKIDEQIARLTAGSLASAKVNEIQRLCAARLERRTDSEAIRDIVGEWVSAVGQANVEIGERLRNGANVVYCTCNSATERHVSAMGQFGVFDWVIVEEAAKAWPIELALPLVRGMRWTLIGDHRQLGAFDRESVSRFLLICESLPDKELQTHGRRRDEYARVFDFFKWLFEGLSESSDEKLPTSKRRPPPLGELTHQFRMRRPIADVISRAFYCNRLTSDDSTNKDSGLVKPGRLAGAPLVWLDTAGVESCRDELCSNPGEARLIAGLLHQMRFRATPENELEKCIGQSLSRNRDYTVQELLRIQRQDSRLREEFLAILSPYREQVDKVLPRQTLPLGCSQCLHTVNAFQGREANVVVVSLVRDQVRGRQPTKRIGFLVQKELVNVLFSRAKRLLVVVGNYEHFRQCGEDFWRVVCEGVEASGHVLRAEQVVEVQR